MKELLYSASDIAMIMCIHKVDITTQIDFLRWIWYCDRIYLDAELADDRKKLFLDVEHQCHYFYDKITMDAEFPAILKDMSAIGGTLDEESYMVDFEDMDIFFKNMRYRILYLESSGYVRMKIRTLLRKYGYKKRTASMNEYFKKCLFFYHIETYVKGNVPCDITEVSLDTMVTFRVC